MKNCVSNSSGVESNGVPGIEGSTWSAAATVCLHISLGQHRSMVNERDVAYEARRATTSAAVKPPASEKRARMLSTVSNGSGTVLSGAGWVASGRPMKTSSWGAPGQLLTPMAPANWMLHRRVSKGVLTVEGYENLQVSGGDVVALDEGALLVDDLVDTEVGVEVGLDVLEDSNGTVSSSTSVYDCQWGVMPATAGGLTRIGRERRWKARCR